MHIFDIDGVVADLQPFFIKDLCQHVGCTPAEIDITTHNIKVPGYNISDDTIFDIAVNTTVKYVDEIKPYKHAIEYLIEYQQYTGDTIHFLTARKGASVEKATHTWLNTHLKADFIVHFNADKVQFMRSNPQFNVVFEDRFTTANELDFVPWVYLLNRPWNIGRIAKNHVTRIDSMYLPNHITCG